LVDQTHHDPGHHLFFVGFTLRDHQRQCNQRVVRQFARPVGVIEQAVLLEEPDEEKSGDPLIASEKEWFLITK
jgi:hypothetical protein